MKLKIKLRENKFNLKEEEEEIEDTTAQDETEAEAEEAKKREAVLKQNNISIDNLHNYLKRDSNAIKHLMAANIQAKENDFNLDQLFKVMLKQLETSSGRLKKLYKIFPGLGPKIEYYFKYITTVAAIADDPNKTKSENININEGETSSRDYAEYIKAKKELESKKDRDLKQSEDDILRQKYKIAGADYSDAPPTSGADLANLQKAITEGPRLLKNYLNGIDNMFKHIIKNKANVALFFGSRPIGGSARTLQTIYIIIHILNKLTPLIYKVRSHNAENTNFKEIYKFLNVDQEIKNAKNKFNELFMIKIRLGADAVTGGLGLGAHQAHIDAAAGIQASGQTRQSRPGIGESFIRKELNLLNINEVLLKEHCNVNNNTNKDLSQLENIISQFYPYVKEKLKFNKDAKLNLISDPDNAKDAWGKTAYYNPEAMEITVFVDNRHPKDMLRSISHELVHHSQNCRGEFDQTQALEPGYAQNDPHMRRMEGEAYLLGNGFLVRDFEDYLKSQQNQNLTENKKMKGLTKEQLKTVLENTIKRIVKENNINERFEEEYVMDDEGHGSWRSMSDSPKPKEEPSYYESEREKCRKRGMAFSTNREECVDKSSTWLYEDEEVNEEEVIEEGFGEDEIYSGGSWHSTREPSQPKEEPTWYEGERERCRKMGMIFSGATKDCVSRDSILAIYEEEEVNEEEVIEEVSEELSETFTSKKDQLLFERLVKKWAK